MLQCAAADRLQMFHTAHQFSSREGITKRLHSLQTVKAFSFCCHHGTATREEEDIIVFFSLVVQRPKEEQENRPELSTMLSNKYKLKHKDKTFSLTDQRCGMYHNKDRFTANTWPGSQPQGTVLTEPFTFLSCSHLPCQSVRQKA